MKDKVITVLYNSNKTFVEIESQGCDPDGIEAVTILSQALLQLSHREADRQGIDLYK